ncbi:MAG: polysaccharide pyruvyl transferase family protein [Clostridia bacterium]
MKIGILTFHNAHNYGATLQAFALRTILREMGHDTHIINYRNDYLEKRYDAKLHLTIGKREIINPFKWLGVVKRYYSNKFAQDEWSKQYANFKSFINEIILENNISSINKEELSLLPYDVFICGSDQIWNAGITNGLDSAYFLEFQTNAKKISYAASIAHKQIIKNEKEYFKQALSDFDYISVREESAVITLKEIVSKKISVTLDPTLLLDVSAYDNLLADNQEKDKYIFVYFISENKELMECAEHIAQEMGYKLVELHYYLQKNLIGHNQRADLGPREFLTYMKNAEFILTNSFHGTVFSMLYHKKFYSVYGQDERKDNILNAVNLQSRHIKNKDEIDLNSIIDYEKVDKYLEEYRNDSLEFLDYAIGE